MKYTTTINFIYLRFGEVGKGVPIEDVDPVLLSHHVIALGGLQGVHVTLQVSIVLSVQVKLGQR